MIIDALKSLITTDNTTTADYRFYTVSQLLYRLGILIHGGFIVYFYLLGVMPLAYFNVVSTTAFAVCIVINKRGLHLTAMLLAFSEIIAHAFLGVYHIGWESGLYYYLFLAVPVIFLNPKIHMSIKLTLALSIALLYSVLYWMYHDYLYGIAGIAQHHVHTINYISTVITVTALAAIGHYYARAAAHYEKQLSDSRDAAILDANTDSLTQLLNRRAMTRLLERLANRKCCSVNGCALVMCDIDNFKDLNDRFGHGYGDEVLVSVSRILKDNLRKQDIVARWGGEEFLIMLPDTTEQESLDIIERVREAIEHLHSGAMGDSARAVTMTFGMVHITEPTAPERCIQQADNALYEGKHAGKNRVAIAC